MNEDDELNIYFISSKYGIGSEFNNSTIEECYNYLKNKTILSLDIETTRKYNGNLYVKEGLDPYTTNIVMFQIGDLERQYVIDYRDTDISILLPLLTDESITIVGQNIKFEYLHILHNEKIRLNNVYDTMVVEQILFNGLNPKASLKALNSKYLGIDVDKGTRLEFLTIRDRPFNLKQIKYGAEDILYPLKIRKYQLLDAKTKDVENCISLEMLFLLVLGDIEYKGMHFDTTVWKNTYDNNLTRVIRLREELNEYVLSNYTNTIFVDKQLSLFSNKLVCKVNWGSSKQVIEFFNYLGICPKSVSPHTNKLSFTVNSKVLSASLKVENKDIEQHKKDLVHTYLKFKEVTQSCTTFGLKFFKNINPITKRLHSNYRQILNTGRISSNGPNLQNIPATKEFRSAFTAPKGYKIVNADYSGQEQIILANKSQDKDLLEFYRQGLGDMHKQKLCIQNWVNSGKLLRDNPELSLQLNAA